MVVSLKDLTIENGFDIDTVESYLQKYGVAVLPSLIQGEELEQAKHDWQKLRDMRDHKISGIRRIGGDIADYAALDRNIIRKNEFHSIERIFASNEITKLANKVIGSPCMMNSEVYATYDIGNDKALCESHFDKTWTLKFMLYLEDNLETKGGAFGIHPGSMGAARKIYREWFDRVSKNGALDVGTDEYYSMPNEGIPNNLLPFVEILAPAGSLLIFNTDVYHAGSFLQKGKERKILRAHTYPGKRLLGIGDRVKRNSRSYERGESWEQRGKLFSTFSKIGISEFFEEQRVKAKNIIKKISYFFSRFLYFGTAIIRRLKPIK